MRKKLIAAVVFAFLLSPTTPLVTGVAHAGCTGTPMNHTFHCDCNPGFYWDANMSECQATQAWIDANKPRGPFVCSTTGLICNMP